MNVFRAITVAALVLLTALAGAHLARMQGLAVMMRIRENLAQGFMPAEELLDGLLIFLATTQLLGTLLLFASSSSGGVRGGIGSLTRSLQALRAEAGEPAFYLLLALGLALAVCGSYRLSARFFERSDL